MKMTARRYGAEVAIAKNRMAYVLSLLAMMLMLIPAGVFAAETPIPAEMQFHTIVDTAFVQQYVKIPKPADVMIIDSRPANKFGEGYIPTAVSIPDSQFEKMASQLPENKNALLIFYCGGLHCPLSHKSAKKAEALGYKNVKVFAEGMPGWKKAGNAPAISVEMIATMMNSGDNYMLVDSRPTKKFLEGSIPSAISLPDSKFMDKLVMLPAGKDVPLIFFCGGYACPLSHKSAAKAKLLGYSKIMIAEAGYPGWKEQFGAAAAVAVKAGAQEGSVDIPWFEKTMKENPAAILLVDVRDAAEFAQGHMKNAVNIPVDALEKNIASLSADKPIVFVCASGARSGEAYYMVRDMRPEIKDVFYLEAETTYNADGTFEIKTHK
ncbi:rhodanese-like domain-containing protein [Desulfovibrio mangrovi]|uniref:rhodanese-like domain-containing protein n=1 Tax=Desulfovibrio mangrovi TaxID=2976983 RepID=UPI00224849E0|nr:rhodanese-like domain-containing protein [Desulfovibrio mangrovi]UZP68105.1 rhodanese-like domain-containing protein [Desulfovibrio mangrovi]